MPEMSPCLEDDRSEEREMPETPLCSEAEDEDEEDEEEEDRTTDDPAEEDEVDGWMSSVLIDTVKSAVYHLLNIVLHKHRVDRCNGCKTDHPSQRQHECLDVLEEDYHQDHFYRLMKMLFTPRFIPSIQLLLVARNIKTEDSKVRTVAETLLHELRAVKKIFDPISDAYDSLVGDDVVKIGQLRMVTQYYTHG